jgi:hypothetical protein
MRSALYLIFVIPAQAGNEVSNGQSITGCRHFNAYVA